MKLLPPSSFLSLGSQNEMDLVPSAQAPCLEEEEREGPQGNDFLPLASERKESLADLGRVRPLSQMNDLRR